MIKGQGENNTQFSDFTQDAQCLDKMLIAQTLTKTSAHCSESLHKCQQATPQRQLKAKSPPSSPFSPLPPNTPFPRTHM